MRLEHIHIENFQGIRALDLELPTPITLVAGHNGAGKSSLAEAIRLALGGDAARVGLKKEYPALVTEGAKIGAICLDLDGAPVSITLPGGKRAGEAAVPTSPALPYVLAPEMFMAAKADDRRTLLFALTGVSAKADEIERRLLERGCDATLVTQIKPILRTGFAAGAAFAAGRATEAKGAWRGVTHETWGSKKAETWEAEIPAYDQAALDAARASLAELEQRIEVRAKSLGALEQQTKTAAARASQVAQRAEQAAKLPALLAKLQHDEAELANWTARVEELQARAGTAPREGLVHDLARALGAFLRLTDDSQGVVGYHLNGDTASWDEFDELNAAAEALKAYEAQYGPLDATVGDPKAAAELPRAIEARDLLQRAVNNDRRDIAAAEAAGQEAEDDSAEAQVSPADLEAARASLARLRQERQTIQERVDELLNAQQAAVSAAARTENARRYHAEVMAWGAIGDALSPDGIPGEILADALQPLNSRLADLAGRAGWSAPVVAADMGVTAAGRPYRLLSESEQWRVDALIALALANLSGLRCVILDRFDCLDPDGRVGALELLDDLARDEQVDTVLLLGTLAKPPAPPSEMFTVHWFEGGQESAEALRQAA